MRGNAAIVKVVETQIELFRLNEDRVPSKEELIAEGYVSEEQYAIYERRRTMALGVFWVYLDGKSLGTLGQ